MVPHGPVDFRRGGTVERLGYLIEQPFGATATHSPHERSIIAKYLILCNFYIKQKTNSILASALPPDAAHLIPLGRKNDRNH
jgi:hypothetical protein